MKGKYKNPFFYVNIQVSNYDSKDNKHILKWINIPKIFLVLNNKNGGKPDERIVR